MAVCSRFGLQAGRDRVYVDYIIYDERARRSSFYPSFIYLNWVFNTLSHVYLHLTLLGVLITELPSLDRTNCIVYHLMGLSIQIM